jgi:hypothetical protein
MDAAAAAAAADTQPFKCKVCLRGFATREGLNVHWGKVCKRVNPKLVQPTASKAQSNASDNVEAAADAETRLAQMYEKEQRTLVLNDLTRFRYDLFTPDSHISQMKTAMQSWLRLANDELIRRLTPLVGAANQPAAMLGPLCPRTVKARKYRRSNGAHTHIRARFHTHVFTRRAQLASPRRRSITSE